MPSRGNAAGRGLLVNPDALDVPVTGDARPLPDLTEPRDMPRLVLPACRDDEPLVAIAHPRIHIVAAYLDAGWPDAHPHALVRAGVAQRLAAVADALPDGFGLAILDAWRPLALQAQLHAAAYTDPALPAGFVSEPSDDPTTPPPHLTGGAVDLTLTWHGEPLALGSGFDDFTSAAHTCAFEQTTGRVRELRRMLFWAMHDRGFRVLDCEWWHFELGTRRWSALTGQLAWYGAADSGRDELARRVFPHAP